MTIDDDGYDRRHGKFEWHLVPLTLLRRHRASIP
jgi:hypothetical protein